MKFEVIRNDERMIIEESAIEKDDEICGFADWDYDISDEVGLI